MKRLIPILAAGLLTLYSFGCGVVVIPSPGPAVSSARFVRPIAEEPSRGNLMATGGLFATEEIFYGAWGEGSAVFWLGEHYDLSMSGRADSSSIEGNLRILDGPIDVGWTHGVGGRFDLRATGRDSGLVLATMNVTTGLSFQYERPRDRQLFGALRYAYARGIPRYDPHDENLPDGIYFGDTHYIGSSAGYLVLTSTAMNLLPELTLAWSSREGLMILPKISISAAF